MAKVLAVALDRDFQKDLLRLVAVGLTYAVLAGLALAALQGLLVLAYALD